MCKRVICLAVLTVMLVMTGYSAGAAEEIKTKRVRYRDWGFTIELPVGWERQNHKVPGYSFYLCQPPLEKNETEPKAKINMIVGSKKAEHDDEYFFEKTLIGVAGKEIDRGTITIVDPKRKMPGKWIHYSQQRDDKNDVKVIAYKIIEEGTVYLIICYADSDEYENYEALFKKVVMSLRSEKIKISE